MNLEFRNIHIDMFALSKAEKNQPKTSLEDTLITEFQNEMYVTRGVVLVTKGRASMRYSVVHGIEVVRAAKAALIDYVPCLISSTFSDIFIKLVGSISVNDAMPSKPENVIERAIVNYKQITGAKLSFRRAENIAKLGKKSTLYTDKRLAKNLDPRVQQYVKEGKLGKTAAKYISYENPDKQFSLATMVISESWTTRDIELYRAGGQDSPIRKTMYADIDTIQKEIEEYSGYKTQIIPKTKNTGTMKINFYGTEQMIDIAQKLLKLKHDCTYTVLGRHNGEKEKQEVSEISIKYSNLDIIDDLKAVLTSKEGMSMR